MFNGGVRLGVGYRIKREKGTFWHSGNILFSDLFMDTMMFQLEKARYQTVYLYFVYF